MYQFNENLIDVMNTIKSHLKQRYGTGKIGHESIWYLLEKERAIILTRLRLSVTDYIEKNRSIHLSPLTAMNHMIYEDGNVYVKELHDIPADMVLSILKNRIYNNVVISSAPGYSEFLQIEKDTNQRIEQNKEKFPLTPEIISIFPAMTVEDFHIALSDWNSI
ncbi:hypothetical protein E8Q24_19430 [Salmonella enterica]|nr:hypothetical protein [Salmonella enterica subsp. enterica serovar Dahomey]